MGQFAQLNTQSNASCDVLLDEDFDEFSIQEEWSHSSAALDFKAMAQGVSYEF